MQVVAGQNLKVWINMTCTAAGDSYVVGVTVDAFQPLPSAANPSLQIYDINLE
jgi:hypothetical protein